MIRLAGKLVICSLTAFAAVAPGPVVAQTAGDKPVVISDRSFREAAHSRVEPEYPATARQFRVGGEVVAVVTVGLDGKVESVAISKGNALLNTAVVAALKKWTFTPFMADGHPVKVKSTVTFVFKL